MFTAFFIVLNMAEATNDDDDDDGNGDDFFPLDFSCFQL